MQNKNHWRQLIDDINKGTIKTLFALESDPSVLIPPDTLSKLTNLIIQAGQAVSAKANIIVAHEPLYKKKGTLINNEGRAQALGGAGTNGLDALGIIAGAKFDFNALHESVKKAIGITAVDEFTIPKYDRPAYGAIQAAPKPMEAKPALIDVYNPFMWFNLADDNDFVELEFEHGEGAKALEGRDVKDKIKWQRYRKEIQSGASAG